VLTIGVEEEYQLVDPDTRELRPRAEPVLAEAGRTLGAAVQPELYLSQVETGTGVCTSLDEVRAELVRLRRRLGAAAERAGTRIMAAGLHPFSHWQDQPVTPKRRYLNLLADHGQLAREVVVFGCHVHVGFDDRELAVQAMNRALPRLAPILALSANSPYWLGLDTGYASFRTEIWNRWPMSGIPGSFADRAEYDRLVAALVETGTIKEPTKLYWDVRPSNRYETLEFRVADVCATVDEAVMVAGLVRALAGTAADAALAGAPAPDVRPELLRAARWRASRNGLAADLVDPQAGVALPARELLDGFLTELRPALEAAGDFEQVAELVAATMAGGGGAARQRRAYERRGRLADVVDQLVAETAA
jgi:glutamate---cysteine ligase / carboxylate-amine ligase